MKSNKKWMMLAVVIFALTMVLAACGGNNGGKTDTTNKPGTDKPQTSESNNGEKPKDVTLKVWGDLGNQAVLEEPYKKINAAFQDKFPHIKVQYDFAQNEQSLNVALQANELPDLFFVQGDKTPKMAEMVNNGFILALDDFKLDLSRYSDAEIAYGTVNGKLYSALPSFLDTQLVYYNKAIFAENNVAVPTTWDEFVAALDTFKAAGIVPIALPGQSEWSRAWPVFAFGAAHAATALNDIAAGKGELTNPEVAQALQYYRDFADAGYFGKDYTALDEAGAQFAFTNGKSAMIIDGTWNDSLYAGSGIELGRFSLPNTDGKRVVAGSYSNFMTYAVSSNTENPEAAVEYINFINSKEAQQIMEDATGLIPSLSDITPRDEAVKELAAFDEVGPNIYSVLSLLASTQSNTPDIFLKEVVSRLMTSDITGEEGAEILHNSATYLK